MGYTEIHAGTTEPFQHLADELPQILSPFFLNVQSDALERSASLRQEKSQAALLLWLQRAHSTGAVTLEEAACTLLWSKRFWEEHQNGQGTVEQMIEFLTSQAHLKQIQLQSHCNPALCSRVLIVLERQFKTLNLTELAAMMDVNSSYLSRTISKTMGCSFLDLLHCRRILEAVKQFSTPGIRVSVEQISLLVGYSTVHHFYCVFRRYTGFPPKEIRTLVRIMTRTSTNTSA